MAGPTRASGYPDASSTGTSKAIPQIFSGQMVEKFYEASICFEIAMTDAEGEIANQGDLVWFRKIPDVSVSPHEVGDVFTATDYPFYVATAVSLGLDKATKFLGRLDSVDEAQTDLQYLSLLAQDGVMKLLEDADQTALAGWVLDASANNSGDTAGVVSNDIDLGTALAPLELTAANILDFIVDINTVLDEQKVPSQDAMDRFLTLPPRLCALIKKSDLRDASLAGDDTSILRAGAVGVIDRTMIYSTNNVNRNAGPPAYWDCLFGHRAGLVFANQMNKVETSPTPWGMGNLIKGLHLYGFKGIEGKYIGHARAALG